MSTINVDRAAYIEALTALEMIRDAVHNPQTISKDSTPLSVWVKNTATAGLKNNTFPAIPVAQDTGD